MYVDDLKFKCAIGYYSSVMPYAEVGGPELKVKGKELQVIKADAGVLQSKFPDQGITSRAISTNADVSFSSKGASLYGKVYMIEADKTFNIPLPLTNNSVNVTFTGDLGSLGGGAQFKDYFKIGVHAGVGGDITIKLNR